jgi:hypothetical protein
MCGAAILQHFYTTNETPSIHTHEGATWSQVDVLFTDEFCMVSAFSRFSINVYDSSKYVQKSHFSEFI